MPYFERRIYSGNMLEVERYCATNGGRPIGSRNTGRTTEEQEALNTAQSWRKLWRMINCNFSRKNGDMCITLRFCEPISAAEANAHYQAFMRRVRTVRKRKGLADLRYILIRDEQSDRQHAHMIVNGGIPFAELSKLWKCGMLWGRLLDNTDNHKELARYLTKQYKPKRGSDTNENAKAAHQKNKRRWTCSRNLARPTIKKRLCKRVTLHTAPSAPKGYELTAEAVRGADWLGNLWLKWVCRKIPEQKRNRKPGTLRGRMAC